MGLIDGSWGQSKDIMYRLRTIKQFSAEKLTFCHTLLFNN